MFFLLKSKISNEWYSSLSACVKDMKHCYNAYLYPFCTLPKAMDDRWVRVMTGHGFENSPHIIHSLLRCLFFTLCVFYCRQQLHDMDKWLQPSQLQQQINTLRPRQNGCHFPDIFKCIFFKENVWILIKMWLKFVPKSPVNNIPSLLQIMAWCQTGNKPLSEAMMA